MGSLISPSTKKTLWYLLLISLAIALIDYYYQQQRDAEWDRNVFQNQRKKEQWQQRQENKQEEYILSPKQKQRQKDALKRGHSSSEPLPSEVSADDEEKYNWIMDHPDYNGDYEHFEDKYESEHGDYDDYER